MAEGNSPSQIEPDLGSSRGPHHSMISLWVLSLVVKISPKSPVNEVTSVHSCAAHSLLSLALIFMYFSINSSSKEALLLWSHFYPCVHSLGTGDQLK